MDSMGRNEPCYCGSGKKYKKCHMLIESATRTDRDPRYEAFRAMRNAADASVLKAVLGLLTREEVDGFLKAYESPPFLSPEERRKFIKDRQVAAMLTEHAADVLIRAYRTESGESLGMLAATRNPSRFTSEQKDYLFSEHRNIVTFIQAREFFPDEGTIIAEDIFDGDVYRIYDYAMARNPMPHAIAAARLIPYPHGQGFVMDPLGKTVFEPDEKDDLIAVVAAMVGIPGLRGARLKEALKAKPLVCFWSALWSYHRWMERPAPILVNPDGSPFKLRKGKSGLSDFEAPKKGAKKAPRISDFSPDMLQEIGRQMFEKWMRETLDSPVPILGGLSPRACCATPEGKRKVRAWIDGYEHDLARKVADPVMGAFDMDEVRRQLGLLS